jgi:hypothetical protein
MRYTETKDSAVSPVIGIILMVAIAVILTAVIGTFVLGLGQATGSSGSAGVSIEQVPGESVEITVTDTGNLDGLRIVAPDGSRSGVFRRGEILRANLKIELRDGGFPPETVTPAIEPNGKPMDLVNGGLPEGSGPVYGFALDDRGVEIGLFAFDLFDFSDGRQNLGEPSFVGGGVLNDGVFTEAVDTNDLTVNESCRVQAPETVRGIDLNGIEVGAPDRSTILRPHVGCSLRNLQGYLADDENSGFGPFFLAGISPLVGDDISNPGSREAFVQKVKSIEPDAGSPMKYMEGEYKLVGVVDGKENVFQTFTVEGG